MEDVERLLLRLGNRRVIAGVEIQFDGLGHGTFPVKGYVQGFGAKTFQHFFCIWKNFFDGRLLGERF